ncbi:MFS transporter [Actinomadura napierensis]|uniref:Major facilitator superfamily (MFS) profile domain-containing protein n=1 Tax=Actinomadura napierensis TaxID=267854 RepID=A0ABN2ZA15_9ACTN
MPTDGRRVPATSSDPVSDRASGSVAVPRRWRRLAAITGTLWADNNEGSVLTTLAPVIIDALALPPSALGVLTSVSKAIGILFGPLWTWLAHRTGRKGVLIVSTAFVAAGSAVTGLAQNFVQLLLLWSLVAVFAAASLPVVTEITADLFDARARGRASGYTFGALAVVAAVLGPLLGQLSRFEGGWRIGFYASGALGLAAVLFVAVGFQDPGVGASEPALRRRTAEQREADAKLTPAKLRSLAAIPTFVLMLGQRLISGHLLVTTYGVLFLVKTYGFSTATASVVVLPLGIGYLVGTIAGGLVTDGLHARMPGKGRVIVLQAAQFGFAATALVGMQVDWHSIGVFAAFWAVMGLMQGINPGVNRPIVMAVVPPELRGAAFALMLSVFEALAFIAFNLGAGLLIDAVGLKNVMLWIPGILMLVNGVYCGALYRTYPRDMARLDAMLGEREAGKAP